MKFNIQIQGALEPLSGTHKTLQVIDCEEPGFDSKWGDFLSIYPIHTYRYDLEIYKYRIMESRDPVVNRSFLIVGKQDVPLAICPLFITKNKVGDNIAGFGEWKFLPIMLSHPNLSEKQRRSIEDFAFKEYVTRIDYQNASRLFVEAEVMSVGTDLIEDQVMARKGALDVSIHQHIVDLRPEEAGIRSQLRRRALTEINGGLRNYDFFVVDQQNYTKEVGDRHFDLHKRVSGRLTRPKESFLLSYEWIKKGRAFFVEQKYDGRTVNMTLVLTSKKTAIGASTAVEPEFEPPVPLMHSMMWRVMMECRERNIEFFEIGETNFRDTLYQVLTEKEKSIVYFKRGFGEHSWPLKRWVWFRNPQYELEYLQQAVNNYTKCFE